MAASPLYLIDASIYIFRAWFSVPQTMLGADQQPVNALFGYFDFLTRFIEENRPQHIVAVFDGKSGKSARKDIYPEYKSNRDPIAKELRRQFALCRLLTRALGVSETAHDDYEADDVIGSLASRAAQEGARPVVIVSGDKDLAQLVERGDAWWDYPRKKQLGYEDVKEQFGVYPDQIADLLAIAGDPSDSIPGVRGIGRVTAARLLEHFGSLQSMLDRTDEIEQVKMRGAKRVAALVKEGAADLAMARRLTIINREAPVAAEFPTSPREPDAATYKVLDGQLGFSAYRRRQYERCVAHLAGAA